MTDVTDNVASESSDNEEIIKLFPRCKPKVSNDFNLNKLNIQNVPHFLVESNGNDSAIGQSDGEVDTQTQVDYSNVISNIDCQLSRKMDCVMGDKQDGGGVGSTHDDQSVVSAYDSCNISRVVQNRSSVQKNTNNTTTTDIGEDCNRSFSEFRLRESRIEIAGGREVFSSSRSKMAKKRYSDEVVYPSPSFRNKEIQRHSGEMTCDYTEDGKLTGYRFRSTAPPALSDAPEVITPLTQPKKPVRHQNNDPDRQNHHHHRVWDNSDGVLKRGATDIAAVSQAMGSMSQGMVGAIQGVKSSRVVYETPVCGSEVIFDDIGDFTDQLVNCDTTTSNLDANQLMMLREYSGKLTVDSEQPHFSDEFSPSSTFRSPISELSKKTLEELNFPTNGGGGSNNNKLANYPSVDSLPSPEQDGGLSSDGCVDSDPETFGTITHIDKPMKLIGNIPIAEYEGSPRRYGPRPGFPQRVVTDVPPRPENSVQPDMQVINKLLHRQPEEEEGDDVDGGFKRNQGGVTSAANRSGHNGGGHSGGGHNGGGHSDVNADIESLTRSLLAQSSEYGLTESETQKVLEEFYKQDNNSELGPLEFSELEYKLYRMGTDNSYVGRRLAQFYGNLNNMELESPRKGNDGNGDENCHHHHQQRFLDNSFASQESINRLAAIQQQQEVAKNTPENCLPSGGGYISSPSETLVLRQHEEKSLLDPFDHDCETISTNPDTEDLGDTETGEQVGQSRNFTLSPETTDCDSNDVESEVSFENEDSVHSGSRVYGSMPVLEDGLSSGQASDADDNGAAEMEGGGNGDNPGGSGERRRHHSADNPTTLLIKKQISEIEKEFARCAHQRKKSCSSPNGESRSEDLNVQYSSQTCVGGLLADDTDMEALDPLRQQPSPPSPAPSSQQQPQKDDMNNGRPTGSVDAAIKEIKQAIRKSKSIPMKTSTKEANANNEQPVWLPRPLYSQHLYPSDDDRKSEKRSHDDVPEEECDTDQETDRLLGKQRTEEERQAWCKHSSSGMSSGGVEEDETPKTNNTDTDQSKTRKEKDHRKKGRSKEVLIHEPAVLIEGVLFRARYLGSTQLVCEGQPTKATRMMQAEEAVSRIKAPEGENQPSTEVDLFISTEKIMVLNTDLKEIMMDHSLRTISYIADIGDLVVLMARRRMLGNQEEPEEKRHTPKMICHVFESEEAQFIAQSIGQAFQVAYMEFLKANGIEDHSFVKEMDYQEVLNSQEIYGDELEMFAKKEMQKEVIVPKARGEMLGVVIVESGWGSMLPTVVIANLSPNGAAARCGQLNIGDQIIAINGISLVGLPLSTCQHYIKSGRNQMVVKLTVVPCPPVVEVKIKRPDTKYQLGFSVQNGVICSLLRGGIAERGGVRVGHRIIEINGQSVVAVPHERIVNLLATSVGEILMKTMPTSMFRLLTGQETPIYI